jgi:dihydrofolate reductase
MNLQPVLQVNVFLGVSLDGYIAGEQGDLSWMAPCAAESTADTGYDDLMVGTDTLLMGRRTYESVLRFPGWPYAGKRVRVLSHRPQAPSHGEQFCSGPVSEVLDALQAEGARSVYLDGGDVVRQALRAGRVDTLTLSWVPVLLGGGTRLFEGGLPRSAWQLIAGRAFASGMVQARYQRIARAPG